MSSRRRRQIAAQALASNLERGIHPLLAPPDRRQLRRAKKDHLRKRRGLPPLREEE